MFNSAYEIATDGSVILTIFMNGELTRKPFGSMAEMEAAYSDLVTVKRVMASMPEEIAE